MHTKWLETTHRYLTKKYSFNHEESIFFAHKLVERKSICDVALKYSDMKIFEWKDAYRMLC